MNNAPLTRTQIQTLGGWYYLAPASDPSNPCAVGIDGNRFASPNDAEEAVEALRNTPGFEDDYVIRFCDCAA